MRVTQSVRPPFVDRFLHFRKQANSNRRKTENRQIIQLQHKRRLDGYMNVIWLRKKYLMQIISHILLSLLLLLKLQIQLQKVRLKTTGNFQHVPCTMTDQTDQNVTELCQFLRKQCMLCFKTSVDLCRVYIDLCIFLPFPFNTLKSIYNCLILQVIWKVTVIYQFV